MPASRANDAHSPAQPLLPSLLALCSPTARAAAHPRVSPRESPRPLYAHSHPERGPLLPSTSPDLLSCHLRFPHPSPQVSRLLCAWLFFLLFFFPPNLVSIETRLAEGEIKQPHVTQIPTLKNLLVALAVALHNQEPVRAQMGGPGSAEGHRAQPRRTRLRCTGSDSGEEYQAQLWRDHQAEGSDASPPLALGVLWHS